MQRDLFREAPADPPVIVAYGAGVDSTAMILGMIDRGERIDLVLHADTGSEKPETEAYRDMFLAWLRARGIRCEIVRYQPQRFKHWPPYRSLDENCFTNGTLPSISFGRHSCSLKWKVEPQDAWLETWEPAVACWEAGGRCVKAIGYDAGTRDSQRYAHSEGMRDPRFDYRYPLREWGWDREECERQIAAHGLPVPVKSACFMCAASKPWEIEALGAPQLRRIVLMEARARPRLRNVEGLWRKRVQGRNGATPRPGAMTDFIRERGLLPAAEIDEIISLAPAALARFQDAEGQIPLAQRAELSTWLKLFDARDRGIFNAGERRFYDERETA
jgi:3'-phosphoadenosine 5'-phosphosulfate sulfotransferase (PAPS reductase)/FAD synthetase